MTESASTGRAVTRRYVDLADGQLHLRERTGAQPAIVFLHQTALSSRCYESLMREPALAGRHLIALDLPGFGQSFRPGGWPSMQHYAGWVLEALDALGPSRAHFFGHHTGASVATEIAHRQAARVQSLMLCGPVCFTRSEARQFRSEFEKALAPVADGSHLFTNWRYTSEHNSGLAAETIHDQVVDMLIAWRARPQAYVAVADHDFEAVFRALTIPTLIVSSPGDYFEDHVLRCLALRPGLDVVHVGGGNLAPEVDSAGTARAIAEFVARVESV